MLHAISVQETYGTCRNSGDKMSLATGKRRLEWMKTGTKLRLLVLVLGVCVHACDSGVLQSYSEASSNLCLQECEVCHCDVISWSSVESTVCD